jgi:hypothetical protein
MAKKFFSLEIRETDKLTKIFQIIFGILCVIIAIFWLIFNFRSVKADRTLWITVVFLFGFGLFLLFSGFGYASKFIELNTRNIRLKKNSLFPPIYIYADQIDSIEIFPLKLEIIIKPAKKILLRFGISDPEKIDLIKDEIIRFADTNKINLEIKEEQV